MQVLQYGEVEAEEKRKMILMYVVFHILASHLLDWHVGMLILSHPFAFLGLRNKFGSGQQCREEKYRFPAARRLVASACCGAVASKQQESVF